MREIQVLYMVAILLMASFAGFGFGNVSAAGNNGSGAGNMAFGQMVADFVHSLEAAGNQEGGVGFQVATFVLDHNPAAAMIPDHAGPPAPDERGTSAADDDDSDADTDDSETGPPDDPGPPDDAGPPNSDTSTDDGDEDEKGPPDDAGNADSGNGGGGPPDQAGPPS